MGSITDNDKEARLVRASIQKLGDARQARILSRFFKTAPGEYGEGDLFLGIKVPIIRSHVKENANLQRETVLELLHDKYHEVRLFALLVLVRQFERSRDEDLRQRIFNDYLSHARFVNNWDLVDLSAPNIVGTHLLGKGRGILRTLAKSKSLWERRIAIVSTFAFIRNGEDAETYGIASLLMKDPEDLIHKATGWMIREAGKRVSEPRMKDYISKNLAQMPRTMLRYAIERLSQKDRDFFMRKPAVKRK